MLQKSIESVPASKTSLVGWESSPREIKTLEIYAYWETVTEEFRKQN